MFHHELEPIPYATLEALPFKPDYQVEHKINGRVASCALLPTFRLPGWCSWAERLWMLRT